MIETGNYVRFERVAAVDETERGCSPGCTASNCGRPVRDDVVRVKISRGGAFDEAPTYAVCVDPLAEPVEFTVERDGDGGAAAHLGAGGVAVARPVPARRAPHRRQRRSSSRRRTRRAVLGVRDAERRVHDPPPLPAGGRDLRAGREDRPAQPRGPRLHAVEHRRPRPGRDRGVHRRPRRRTTRGRTGRASSSTRTTSRSRSSTTRPIRPGRWRRRSSTTATAARYDFSAPRGVPHPLRRRPVHRVHLRRARHAGHPRRLHLAHRPDGAAAAVGARLPPVPLVRLHPGRGRGSSPSATATTRSRATRCGSTSSTWTATASSPGTPSVPRRRRACSRGWPSRASGSSPSSTRASSTSPGYGVFDQARRARRALPDRGRRHLHRPGVAGQHRVPGLRHRGGARVVGRAQRRARRSPGWPASGTT